MYVQLKYNYEICLKETVVALSFVVLELPGMSIAAELPEAATTATKEFAVVVSMITLPAI
ncbi:Hypothetical protein POVN_LOCUS388 [uncultured virus]|nr:Hypothetical protein POVN_LOCUS388 [uncultured virus]